MAGNSGIKWLVIVVVLIGLSALYIGSNQGFSVASGEGIQSCEVSEDGSVACLQPAGGQPFAISLSEPTARPGEEVSLDILISMPGFSSLNSAKFVLYDENYRVLNTWDFKDTFLAYYGCNQYVSCYDSSAGQSRSFNTVLTFDAPEDPGTYIISYKITGKRVVDGVVDSVATTLMQEQKSFEVTRIVDSECPADECESWQRFDSITGGDLYQRSCYEYGGNFLSGCQEQSVIVEYRTDCDTGYHIQGHEGVRSTTGARTCVADPVPIVTCYRCDNGDIEERSAEGSCPSGFSVDPPACLPPVQDEPAPGEDADEPAAQDDPVVNEEGYAIVEGACVQSSKYGLNAAYASMEECIADLVDEKNSEAGSGEQYYQPGQTIQDSSWKKFFRFSDGGYGVYTLLLVVLISLVAIFGFGGKRK